MASVRVESDINARPEDVWDALRDWGLLHERLAPGFVTDTRLEGTDRIVTFFNGSVVREILVDCDDDSRRLSWSIVGGPYTHHNGSAQVLAEGDGPTLFVWIADFLPDDLRERTAEMMTRGSAAIKAQLERVASARDQNELS